MKIVTIIGARPQFIKHAILSKEIRKYHNEIVIHTGQHYDFNMSELFFNDLDIPNPDYNLNIGSGPHGEQTGEMLSRIEKVLRKEKPDLVLVYGDTNSTLAGALAASKLNIKIVHVEAGLRSFDKSMPEEINRVIVDHVSDYKFCPSYSSICNLAKEGMTKNVYDVGDVMGDILKENLKLVKQKYKNKYVLVTIHRPSNTDNEKNLTDIVNQLNLLEYDVIFPVHPRTANKLDEYGLMDKLNDNVKLIRPVGYTDMLGLESYAEFIITDSGGIQKEAYLLGIPCITVRGNTEWIETVNSGWNVLSKPNEIKKNIEGFKLPEKRLMCYGDKAVEKIVRIINMISN